MVQYARESNRARVVLETSGLRKTAMLEAADLQGTTLADWFDEQVSLAIPQLSSTFVEDLMESYDVAGLSNAKALFRGLEKVDWSFSDDDTRYLTHDLHPYPAKFIPQIPAHLIARLSVRGDLVCDPFGGSSTTAVEAVRLGRRAVSIDANPLSEIIGRVKTGFLSFRARADLEQLLSAVEGHLSCAGARGATWADELTKKYAVLIPSIPNIDKWFDRHAIGEMALLRHLIEQVTNGLARDAALLALSRITIRVSNQDSETRYVAKVKRNGPTLTLRAYLETLRTVIRRLQGAAVDLQYADAKFIVGDSRENLAKAVGENAIDLIVTSPPYPNATDYHLYHRFRLFWLGFDPRLLGQVEIGSHLRHQRNDTGFEEYRQDMTRALSECLAILKPGRYAVFVVGDALFKGKNYSTSKALREIADDIGFAVCGTIDRKIHVTKRSFAAPGRRARNEQLVILRKPNKSVYVNMDPPKYKMWPYEQNLRVREIEVLTGNAVEAGSGNRAIGMLLGEPELSFIRKLTFTGDISFGDDRHQSRHISWQKALEGGDGELGRKKDPKYVTHGLHPFKGKFYPQLAKSLLNVSGASTGDRLFDPFCGSGTTLLEGMLNGFSTFGCDINPLAAKIARAKTAILTIPRSISDLALRALIDRMTFKQTRVQKSMDQFEEQSHEELVSWFPLPVLHKLNWLLGQVRSLGNDVLVDYLEIIVSSIIRDISHQDPTDLRIRRRKIPLQDAPVYEMFHERLANQYSRLQRYWAVAGMQPGRLFEPVIKEGDSRSWSTIKGLGLEPGCVDCIITSPPYATALPYIDTDRLSLLAIFGYSSRGRATLEKNLVGSREIRIGSKEQLESEILHRTAEEKLPSGVVKAIRNIYKQNTVHDVGFRRANMAALLWRYYIDMKENLIQMRRVLKVGAKAFYVVGDSRTFAGNQWIAIETCRHIVEIAKCVGLQTEESIPISVTTDNHKHIKNAITTNQILAFVK